MKRWPLEDLTDYMHGVAAPEIKAAIESDLARPGTGSGEPDGYMGPRADLALLAEIAAALREDQRHGARGPSEDTLLGLSAMFTAATAEPDPPLAPLPLLSVIDPNAGLYAGLRSAQLGHKDLEIHGQRFDLELSIDTPFDGIDVVVVGRLTAADTESWSVEKVPAILVAGSGVLGTAVTNRFGEFHVAAKSEAEDVELCLLISGVGQIRVPIERKDPALPGRA